MAELHFFGTWVDSTRILADLLASEDLRMVIDLDYPEPSAQHYAVLDDSLMNAAFKVSKMYVFGPFSMVGPAFWRQEKGEKAGSFYLYPNRGGPSLTLALPKETDSGLLGHGVFSHHSEYENPTTKVWQPPSLELRQAYAKLKKIVRRHIVRRRFEKGSAWIGQDGCERLERAELRLAAPGLV